MKTALKMAASIAIGVWLQFWAVIFAVWYADVLNDIFCDSSFYGAPECSEPRPAESLLVWAVLIGAFAGGSALPAILLRLRWWQVLVSAVVTPIITMLVIIVPIILVLALLAAQN